MLSPDASDDINEIWDHIATSDIRAADRVVADVVKALERLVEHPNIGHYREDLADPSIRAWVVRDYVVFLSPAVHPS